MDKKIDIYLDIDGTINGSETSVAFFQVMTYLLFPEAHITILTNRDPESKDQIKNELVKMKIHFHTIVITSEKSNYIKNNLSKNTIAVMFENEDEAFAGIGHEVFVLKARERLNYNYTSGRWYGSKQTIEMIDE
jgi:hypothetical protein